LENHHNCYLVISSPLTLIMTYLYNTLCQMPRQEKDLT